MPLPILESNLIELLQFTVMFMYAVKTVRCNMQRDLDKKVRQDKGTVNTMSIYIGTMFLV